MTPRPNIFAVPAQLPVSVWWQIPTLATVRQPQRQINHLVAVRARLMVGRDLRVTPNGCIEFRAFNLDGHGTSAQTDPICAETQAVLSFLWEAR